MEDISPMRFVYLFVELFENHGIFDEFDAEAGEMVTSEAVEDLYEIAKEILPEELEPVEAAERMRTLSSAERDHFIGSDEEDVLVDMRDHFAEKMAANGSARGVLREIAIAREAGDEERLENLLELASEFIGKE